MSAPPRLVLATCPLVLASSAAAQPRTAAAPAVPAALFDTSLYNALEWHEIGPFRGGRATAAAGPPDQPLSILSARTTGRAWIRQRAGATIACPSAPVHITG